MQSIQVDSIGRDLEANRPKTKKVGEDDQLRLSKQIEAEKKTGIDKSVEKSAPEDLYVQAEPIEGYTKLYDYFAENLIYPAEALSDSIQGVQTISFIVSANGKPENITISNSLGLPFETEARRLIGNMPLWKPATLNGKPVPSKVAVPLTFQIKKISK
jgi:TonB family protein